jgi:N-acetylglucosamine-6-phosphate deacetylase
MLFENITLVLTDRLSSGGALRTHGGLIQQVFDGTNPAAIPAPGEQVVDGRGGYLAPGFIDLHVHGAQHRDAMEANPAAFAEILKFHAGGGSTSLALTSVAAPVEDLLRLLAAARAWNAQPTSGEGFARLLGVHLEGPYFSAAKAGAQPPEQIRMPDASEIGALLAEADVITQMTLAPELPGALELIAALRARGIIASGGHSDAWDEDARSAFEAGMTQVTHLFNAMSSARRRGPYRVAGLLEYALSEPGIACELIADCHHVSPTLLRLAYRAKGAGGIILITDASAGAGLPDGAAYRLGSRDCVVRGGVGLTADGAALAGSTSTMIRGVANLVRLAGVPLEQAIRMATWNPARALGREDHLGLLAAGKAADLVWLSPGLEVVATYAAGQCIWATSGL